MGMFGDCHEEGEEVRREAYRKAIRCLFGSIQGLLCSNRNRSDQDVHEVTRKFMAQTVAMCPGIAKELREIEQMMEANLPTVRAEIATALERMGLVETPKEPR